MYKDRRMTRRMAGVLKARLPDAGLGNVPEPRKARGKRWRLRTILKACLAAIASGSKSLAETESLTEEMSPAIARMLGVNRRIPDTTMRGLLVRLAPCGLRGCLHRQTKAAKRRKALEPEKLPFGVVAIDGKCTAIEAWDWKYAQRKTCPEGKRLYGLVRTLTCSLVSSSSKVCIDAVPIPTWTNEMGHFQKALRGLVRTYGRSLFRVVSTDAGMCSEANAKAVKAEGKDYLFCIKNDQPSLLAEAMRLLRYAEQPLADTVDVVGVYEVRRRLYKTEEMAGYLDWDHLRTALRVESSKVEISTGEEVEHEDRYFISSLEAAELSDEQWLYMVRQHWAVENQCHHTWDTVFEEDERPWIKQDPQGTLVVMLLRRIAYNMLALFRSVSQRSQERRQTPWRDIIRRMYIMMIGADEADVSGLRARKGLAAIG